MNLQNIISYSYLLLGLSFFQYSWSDNICVGEQVSLDGVKWEAQNLDTSNNVSNLRDIAINNYVIEDDPQGKVETGTLTPLTVQQSGSISTDMKFYFSKKGRYKVTSYDNNNNVVASNNYNVNIPYHTKTRRRIGSIGIVKDVDNNPELEFGDSLRGVAGVDFSFSVTMGNCGGNIADGQLVSFDDIDVYKTGDNEITSTSDAYVLDFDDEEDNSWVYGFNRLSNPGDQFNKSFDDSPSIPLGVDLLCGSSENKFHYYLFYKSNRKNNKNELIPSVWIPFTQFDWSIDYMYASRDKVNESWLGDSIEYGGSTTVPNDFSSVIADWPVWTTYQSSFNPKSTDKNCITSLD